MLKLRPLGELDIPLIETWLYKEHVKKWYEIPDMGITIQDWITEISHYKEDFSWIHYFIVLRDEKPIGLSLFYRCEDSQGEDFGDLPMEGTYGIDYLIGDEKVIGHGCGKEMVRLLVETIYALPDSKRITAQTDSMNEASQRTLLSCGFWLFDKTLSRYVKEKEAIE